jgi:ketose-bisphosphate aldolase
MKNLKYYFNKSQKEKWAIAQFNFSTLEQLKAIIEANRRLKSPFILGTSEGEVGFLGVKEVIALVNLAKIKYKIPIFLNLDHAKNISLIKEAIDFGYDMVHFDGSLLPLEDNIEKTKKIVAIAHKKNVLVEGELGIIKGESKFHTENIEVGKENFTSVSELEKFIKKTKIDILAISIGNVHGVYKVMPHLDLDLLKKINQNTKIPLVLHGGSGILDNEIKESIKLGITKINFNTDLRIVWRNSLMENLRIMEDLKPYKILFSVQQDIEKKVEEKINLINSKNKL